MMLKNKKGQGGIGATLGIIITLVFFFALYPFWQSMFTVAGEIHTGGLGDVIGFIPLLVLFLVFMKVINLDSTGG